MRLLPIHVHQTTRHSAIYYFTRMGGVVELVTVDNKIKPKINLDNAKRGNYIIGSNLLRIAVIGGG